MPKCECYESIEKYWNGTWLNPKYYKNEQSAAKVQIEQGSTTILFRSSESEVVSTLQRVKI